MRLAIFQSDQSGQSPAERLDLLQHTAATADADLLLCPELFLSGYAVGDRLIEYAEPQSGPGATRIAQIARQTSTAIAYGYPERGDGALYNAAQCIAPDGAILANHRKSVLPPGFEASYFIPGHGSQPFTFRGITIALLICYEVEFPEAVRHAADHGAQLVLAPTALGKDWPVVAHSVLPTRAFENGIFIAYANHAGAEGGISYLGASCIVDPMGRDLARASDTAQCITAEIDIAAVKKAQDRLPYLKDRSRLFSNSGSDQ